MIASIGAGENSAAEGVGQEDAGVLTGVGS